MPVFAEHLSLLAEKVEVQARRTASYEALVQIGMQIQAAEADVDGALHLIVERARELLGTDLAWMGLVNEAERALGDAGRGRGDEPNVHANAAGAG